MGGRRVAGVVFLYLYHYIIIIYFLKQWWLIGSWVTLVVMLHVRSL